MSGVVCICWFCNSGPAPAGHTDKIFELTKEITEYSICPDLTCDISKIGSQKYEIEGVGEYTVEVIDSVQDYLELMKEIFDFPVLRAVITGQAGPCPGQNVQKVNVLANALSGGLYASLYCRL